MARKKKRGQGAFAYFHKLLKDNPELLKEKKNAGILERYKRDHKMSENAVVDKGVKDALNNKKSQLRKELNIYPDGDDKAVKSRLSMSNNGTTASTRQMRSLEEQIDDCVAAAIHLDREGLDDVIRLLRSARDEVVLKIGRRN